VCRPDDCDHRIDSQYGFRIYGMAISSLISTWISILAGEFRTYTVQWTSEECRYLPGPAHFAQCSADQGIEHLTQSHSAHSGRTTDAGWIWTPLCQYIYVLLRLGLYIYSIHTVQLENVLLYDLWNAPSENIHHEQKTFFFCPACNWHFQQTTILFYAIYFF